MQLTNTHFQSFLFIATISCQSANVNGISFHLLSTTFSASGVLSHSGNFSGYDSRFGTGTRHSLSTWQILPLPSEASADLLLSALFIHRLCRFHAFSCYGWPLSYFRRTDSSGWCTSGLSQGLLTATAQLCIPASPGTDRMPRRPLRTGILNGRVLWQCVSRLNPL